VLNLGLDEGRNKVPVPSTRSEISDGIRCEIMDGKRGRARDQVMDQRIELSSVYVIVGSARS
jgi:hypothetical protein